MPRSTLRIQILIVSLFWLQGIVHTAGCSGAKAHSPAGTHREAKTETAKANGQTAWPETLRDPFVGIVFVLIPAGEFNMGSTEADCARGDSQFQS